MLVDDGSVVVLGGLLQDNFTGNTDKIPGLGDLPFFGSLFNSNSRSRKKSNLMVFLRPVVVRDAASSDRLSMERYEQMLGGMKEAQPAPSQATPINEGPVLPALPAKN